MPSRRSKTLSVSHTKPFIGAGNGERSQLPIDWSSFLRRVERKRRLLGRLQRTSIAPPVGYYQRATFNSFRLEGLDVSEAEVHESLGRGMQRPMLRSRQGQRIRTHAAILRHIENDLREGRPLRTDGVLRWYTGISGGLSTTALDRAAAARLGDVVQRINSPQLRLRAALQEIAAAYAQLLADPLVPGFNGILARLLLRYHLGRCRLPAVLFDSEVDGRAWTPDQLVRRLVELLETSFEELLSNAK
jgi:hypothetical protein